MEHYKGRTQPTWETICYVCSVRNAAGGSNTHRKTWERMHFARIAMHAYCLSNRRSHLNPPRVLHQVQHHHRHQHGGCVGEPSQPPRRKLEKKAKALREEPDFDDPPSDGYQTALAVVVLRDAGVSAKDARIQKAVQWLRTNQRESGRWWTKSLNTTSRFHYVSFSGTAYAALALSKCDALEPTRH